MELGLRKGSQSEGEAEQAIVRVKPEEPLTRSGEAATTLSGMAVSSVSARRETTSANVAHELRARSPTWPLGVGVESSCCRPQGALSRAGVEKTSPSDRIPTRTADRAPGDTHRRADTCQ